MLPAQLFPKDGGVKELCRDPAVKPYPRSRPEIKMEEAVTKMVCQSCVGQSRRNEPILLLDDSRHCKKNSS